MLPTQRTTAVLVLAIVVTLAALVDSLVGVDWDLVAVLAAVVVLQVVALAGLASARRGLPLRPDLLGWVRQRAAATGEPPERVADRALAAYRARLSTGPDETAGGPAGPGEP